MSTVSVVVTPLKVKNQAGAFIRLILFKIFIITL